MVLTVLAQMTAQVSSKFIKKWPVLGKQHRQSERLAFPCESKARGLLEPYSALGLLLVGLQIPTPQNG